MIFLLWNFLRLRMETNRPKMGSKRGLILRIDLITNFRSWKRSSRETLRRDPGALLKTFWTRLQRHLDSTQIWSFLMIIRPNYQRQKIDFRNLQPLFLGRCRWSKMIPLKMKEILIFLKIYHIAIGRVLLKLALKYSINTVRLFIPSNSDLKIKRRISLQKTKNRIFEMKVSKRELKRKFSNWNHLNNKDYWEHYKNQQSEKIHDKLFQFKIKNLSKFNEI